MKRGGIPGYGMPGTAGLELDGNLLAQIADGHQGMSEGHPGRRVTHDGADLLAGLPALTVNPAILAVALVPKGAGGGALKSGVDDGAALRTEPCRILFVVMMGRAVDVPDGLERSPIPIHMHVFHKTIVAQKGNDLRISYQDAPKTH